MKRLLYIIVLVAALMAPGEKSDIAKLQPLELIAIHTEGDEIVIQTDTGDEGRGMDVDRAMEDLIRTTSGIVYLDTANYLLIKLGAEKYADDMAGYLKRTVKLCQTSDDPDLEEAAEFLSVHQPNVTLSQWNSGEELPELQVIENKFILKELEKAS